MARELAKELIGGGIVLLFGQLGVGKTAFVRGLVEGVGGAPEDVSSPTFVLMQQYDGKTPVTHVDLYRLTTGEVQELGLEEVVSGRGLVAIEWADRLPQRFPDAVSVYIEDKGVEERGIRIERPTPSIRSDSSVPLA